jgi:hypothetical protein
MKRATFQVPIKMQIPNTRIEWELYDMPGTDDAAEDLADALIKSMQAGSAHFIENEMERLHKFGARDTEPRNVAYSYLNKLLKLSTED